MFCDTTMNVLSCSSLRLIPTNDPPTPWRESKAEASSRRHPRSLRNQLLTTWTPIDFQITLDNTRILHPRGNARGRFGTIKRLVASLSPTPFFLDNLDSLETGIDDILIDLYPIGQLRTPHGRVQDEVLIKDGRCVGETTL